MAAKKFEFTYVAQTVFVLDVLVQKTGSQLYEKHIEN